MDHDLVILEQAAAAVMRIDRKYRLSNFNDQLAMAAARDQSFNAYAAVRLNLLATGVLASAADVKQMKAIRVEISRARKMQTLVAGALKLVAFLAKFA